MPGSSWTVVKFNAENSVEAVPTLWIFNKQYWPPFQHAKVITAIRKNEEPNTHWPSYEVTIFRNSTYENYFTAREKCKKAESTSDLNSEISAGEEKKKIIIKKRQLSTSEEDEECNDRSLPTPPPLEDDEIDQEVAQTYDTRNKMTAKTKSFSQDSQYRPSQRKLNRMEEMYFKEIIRQQNYFKTQLWQTCEDIRDIKSAGLNQAFNNDIQRQESVFSSFTLPLETEQQLQEVEQFLKNQINFKTSVTQSSRTGGKHSYEFVRRNMSQLLSNQLAERYSWLGKKHKQKFHELKLAEMLIAAREAYNEGFTKKDLEESIKKWLRRAKERSDAVGKKLTKNVPNNR